MNFDTLYLKYEKFIHFLLKKYFIQYNYDEYYQMLLIRLWELEQQFDPKRSKQFHPYIRTKLHFYLLDLLRREYAKLDTLDIDSHPQKVPSSSYLSLELSFISHLLSPKQQLWLTLHLNGYTQKEIHQMMNCALSTVKNYKKTTYAILRKSLSQHL
ncbi:sigma-70 family RNA polymerase sigma factor [Staphylococcus ratti]|uniref:Sigma-70 family RNA polymerase sigma factor n=1 Tax=Staphylococcus ratti TaxID=2892440 RepID=A0ABY3PF28_9STAP|nr:sigma-70 family RNA polymerase sigma factor [Staphylococcus ratti]UEX90908.1 sigma-70 family RNA polymerase sigma factor [Staphylococcus ratti]